MSGSLVGRSLFTGAAFRHVLGGDSSRAADALVGGGEQDSKWGEDAEDDRVSAGPDP